MSPSVLFSTELERKLSRDTYHSQALSPTGPLHFSLLFGTKTSVRFDHHFARLNVERYLGRRFTVIEAAAINGNRDQVLMTCGGEQASFPHGDTDGAVMDLDGPVGRGCDQAERKRQDKSTPAVFQASPS